MKCNLRKRKEKFIKKHENIDSTKTLVTLDTYL